jgi:hypothetical protein
MEVCAADAAKGDANEDFPACGLRSGIILENQRIGFDGSWRVEDAGFHGRDTPHPRCFAQRVRKLLKSKEMTFFEGAESVQE